MSSIIIGVCGGSASGKTTLSRKLSKLFPDSVNVLSLDNYYKTFSGILEELSKINFDHPDSLDIPFFIQHIKDLKAGVNIEEPQYDFANHCRKPETLEMTPKHITIIEGLFLFNIGIPEELFDLKIYMDTPSDIRFIRRLVRDREERGRGTESVINQYLATVRPMYDIYVAPNKKLADIVFSGENYTTQDIEQLADRIRTISLK